MLTKFSFCRDNHGGVALIVGILLLPIAMIIVAGLDYNRAMLMHTKLQAATDHTALELCKTPTSTSTVTLQQRAGSMMADLMGSTATTVDPLTVASNPRTILITTHASSPSVASEIIRVTQLMLTATAQCATPMPKTFEIALVLDNTGSMANSGGSETKMQSLQKAANNFIDFVSQNTTFASDTRISLVPFASSVAVDPVEFRDASFVDRNGKSSLHWSNIKRETGSAFNSRFDIFAKLKSANLGWDWAGCFETLPYPKNVSDGKPSGNDDLYVPLFAPDEPGNGGSTSDASTFSQAFINSYINDKTADAACSTSPANATDAEQRACKYVSPAGAVAKQTAISGLGPNGPNFGCTTKPLIRLTRSFSTLKTTVNAMAPSGQTNIHEGLMWGWRTLSPSSIFADGSTYGRYNTNKVLILMTDGENTWLSNAYNTINKSLYSSLGYFKNADGTAPNARLPAVNANPMNDAQARAAMDALTLEACTKMKASDVGISIFTIGFSVSSDPIDQIGIDLLSKCASPGQAYVANDSQGLITAFERIAQSIGSLRLTK